jgi:predicted GH43/DUF377 family glycosyl hydrolase
MSPRFIRWSNTPAANVKKTHELELFLDSCHDDELLNRANNAFNELEHNYERGHKAEKDRWPQYYKENWGINNLYVIELGRNWRLTYTLVSEVGITALCLEILSHREYNRRFGYRMN